MGEKLTTIEKKVDNLDAKFDTFIDKLENKFVLR
jgi:hypothetical protein